MTETTSYSYNARDQLVSTTDALGHVTTTEYDLAGREIAENDAKGRLWSANIVTALILLYFLRIVQASAKLK